MKRTIGHKLYSLGEFYKINYLAFLSGYNFLVAKKNALLNDLFIERIMLAVTEVNGCALCSFVHTKMALEAGLSNEEIKNMLAGVYNDVPENEISAVLFSQHYAETRGNPTKKSWERIVEIYGLRKARGILGAIRMIMFGNATGIAWGSFSNRLKKRETDERSSFAYEVGMILGTIIYLPMALMHVLLAKLTRAPIISFKEN